MIFIVKREGKSAEQTAQTLREQGYSVLDVIASDLPESFREELGWPLTIQSSHTARGTLRSIQSAQDHFFVKDNHRFEKIRHRDILWMKAENSYVAINTDLKNYLITSDTLGSMLRKTNNAGLIRIHRSYAINMEKVEALEGNQVVISKQRIPIGKNYLADVKSQFPLI